MFSKNLTTARHAPWKVLNHAELELASGYESVSGGLLAMALTSKLWTTTEDGVMNKKKIAPVHPGEILSEEFLKPMDLSQNALARGLGVPPRRINEIVLGKRRLTADTALRLARFFGMSAEFWLGLQKSRRLRC